MVFERYGRQVDVKPTLHVTVEIKSEPNFCQKCCNKVFQKSHILIFYIDKIKDVILSMETSNVYEMSFLRFEYPNNI